MHLLQSEFWRKVKKQEGNDIFDLNGIFIQTTKIPFLKKYVGYIPRANLKDINVEVLKEFSNKNNIIFIKVDPVNLANEKFSELDKLKKVKAVQLQSTVVLDTSKSTEELLVNMSKNHRYSVRYAEKKGVKVKIDSSQESFEVFLALYKKTVSNKGYSARSEEYIKKVWKTAINYNNNLDLIFIATAYSEKTPIASALVVKFENTLYYLYAGSDERYRNLMPGYAVVWGLIKFCKEKNIKFLDLVGIEEDQTSGFSRFKVGFGGETIKYKESFDLIINPILYKLFNLAMTLRKRFSF